MDIEKNNNVIYSPMENEILEENSKDITVTNNQEKKKHFKTLKERIASKKLELSSAEDNLKRQETKVKRLKNELNKLITLEQQEQAKHFFKVLDSKNINIETLLANIDLFIDSDDRKE